MKTINSTEKSIIDQIIKLNNISKAWRTSNHNTLKRELLEALKPSKDLIEYLYDFMSYAEYGAIRGICPWPK
jgi:hypothetical protein